MLGAGLLLQMLILGFFFQVMDYYFDLWVATDKRLMLIEMKGLFTRNISSFDYGRIQDVTTDVAGIIPTLLDFGDVKIQTAGTSGYFVFKDVPKPTEFKDKILLLKDKSLSRAMADSGAISV